jgi:hypothetical protein
MAATTASAHKPMTTTKTAASHGKKAPAKRGVTWRNRQTTPSPDRYREIQSALAAKGYLKPEDATGTWNQNSSDALKKFQTEQNLESSGKINSLSLIALGLGPHPAAAPCSVTEKSPLQAAHAVESGAFLVNPRDVHFVRRRTDRANPGPSWHSDKDGRGQSGTESADVRLVVQSHRGRTLKRAMIDHN